MPPRKSVSKRTVRRKKKSSTEHRRAPRVETKLLTMVREQKDAKREVNFVRTLNLSEKGALIESADPVHVGQRVWVEMLLDFNRVVNVRAQVVYAAPQPSGFVFAGIEFENLNAKERRQLQEQIKARK